MFRCRIFPCFAYFLKIYLDYNWFLSFISYSLVIILYLESFENKLFKLDFSIFIKTCFHGQTLSGRRFFCTVMIFFEILDPFHVSKHFWKYQTLFSKKIRHESTNLNTYSHRNASWDKFENILNHAQYPNVKSGKVSVQLLQRFKNHEGGGICPPPSFPVRSGLNLHEVIKCGSLKALS